VLSSICRREQQLKTGEKHFHSYQQSKKKLRPILSRASRIHKKYTITAAGATAARYNLSSSPESPPSQAVRYNLSSSPDSPGNPAVQRHLSSSPDRAGAAAAVVVRANPLYNMMEEECWWRVDGGDECRVRALGQRAPVDSTPFCFALFCFLIVVGSALLCPSFLYFNIFLSNHVSQSSTELEF
jgi:hypothetical protein